MKFSRFGICSRSDGTSGLSREKCTLSNWRCTTRLIGLGAPSGPVKSQTAGTAAATGATAGKPLTSSASAALTRSHLIGLSHLQTSSGIQDKTSEVVRDGELS